MIESIDSRAKLEDYLKELMQKEWNGMTRKQKRQRRSAKHAAGVPSKKRRHVA